MNKKYVPLIWLGVIVVIAAIIIILISTSSNGGLKDGQIVENSYFSDKVIAIHSISCPYCKIAIPRLEEIERENNLTFYYYDISQPIQLKQVTNLNLSIKQIPTIIIYGKVFIGARTKEQYEQAILRK